MAAWPYNTTTWQRLRKAKLSVQPVCEACERRGVTRLAKAVDHIKAIKAGGEPFPPLDGLMSLCQSCHSAKTNMHDMPGINKKIGGRLKGCDVHGNPLDDDDDWYAEPQGSPQARETQDVVGDTSQSTNARQRPSMGDCGHVGQPGAFAGREAAAAGPARGPKTELVANDSQEGWTPWV